jgi:hypothetical protein
MWTMPQTREALASLQSQPKRKAVEAALKSPILAPRLKGIDLARLDEPEVWNSIPLLTKDELRTIPSDRFYDEFCIAPVQKSSNTGARAAQPDGPCFTRAPVRTCAMPLNPLAGPGR